MKRLVLVFVVAACHGDPAPPPSRPGPPAPAVAAPEPADGARSGSRLKLVRWQSGDGFTTWTDQLFDVQLGEVCHVLPWVDGALYCIPDTSWPRGAEREDFDQGFNDVQPPSATAGTTLLQLAYADENCTQPVVLVGGTVPAFFATWVENRCTALDYQRHWRVDHLYRIGAALPASADVFWRDQPDHTCYGGPSVQHAPAYAIEEVAPSALAAVAERTAPSSERITTTYYTSSDGMQFPVRAHDASFGTDCYFASPLGGPYTCIPNGAVEPYWGRTDLCGRPAAVVPEACPRPPVVFQFDGTPYYSFDPARFFPTGERATGACAGGAMSYFPLGAAIPLATAMLEREHVAGRRLELYHFAAGSWRGRVRGLLHDNEHGQDCYLRATGGSAYCSVQPACGGVSEFYIDASCSTEVRRFDYTNCFGLPPALIDRSEIIASSRRETMTFVLRPTTPYNYECKPDQVRALYELGADLIPMDRFEVFTPVIDGAER